MNMQQDDQLNRVLNVLSELGYDLSKDESKVFVDVVIEALDYVGMGHTIDDVNILIRDKKNSPIYVELAYFIYEKGMPFIHQSLEKCQYDRNVTNGDSITISKVFHDKKDLDVYDAAFNVVKYLNKDKFPCNSKSMYENVKCKKNGII